MAIQYKGVKSSAIEVPAIEMDLYKVHIRTNIQRIDEEDVQTEAGLQPGFHGWEYDEVAYDKDEYIMLQAAQAEENNKILNTILGVTE